MEKEADRAKLDVSDLGVLLEKEEAIRTHLRDSENVLFAGETKESVKVACTAHINVLLRVVLTKVVETEGMPQPPIHPLRDQLELLYHKCGRVSVDTDQIIRDSWYVRKFVGLVKMKTRKEKVSEEKDFQKLCLILNPELKDRGSVSRFDLRIRAPLLTNQYRQFTYDLMIIQWVFGRIDVVHLDMVFDQDLCDEINRNVELRLQRKKERQAHK
ncbi:unnamed protein product [Cladocopium goreaui]|uniref:Uncharacterized protein n=1 Tax=Cladocopium goreaui TaxID=2562237 RepID=A0A9P1DBE6_9DINO|nr:unnamed protein product [Cladocopium goreaui]CAI4006407.1 unnamed protein product [Cladocopium goreaui]